MTTSSGIAVSKELEQAFGEAREKGNVRFLEVHCLLFLFAELLLSVFSFFFIVQVDIVEEQLVCTHTQEVVGSAEEDWKLVMERAVPKTPAIFLYRSDNEQEGLGFKWCFCSWVPDGSVVRKRMLFASSRDTCKKQLGNNIMLSF